MIGLAQGFPMLGIHSHLWKIVVEHGKIVIECGAAVTRHKVFIKVIHFFFLVKAVLFLYSVLKSYW